MLLANGMVFSVYRHTHTLTSTSKQLNQLSSRKAVGAASTLIVDTDVMTHLRLLMRATSHHLRPHIHGQVRDTHAALRFIAPPPTLNLSFRLASSSSRRDSPACAAPPVSPPDRKPQTPATSHAPSTPPPPPTDADAASARLHMVFTCAKCETRAVKSFTKNAYRHGVVIVTCPGCDARHLIADNLGWFGDERNIEEVLATKGQTVTTITDGDIDYSPK